jgi:hypothetical protein
VCLTALSAALVPLDAARMVWRVGGTTHTVRFCRWEKEHLVKMMDKLEPDKFGHALTIIKQSHQVRVRLHMPVCVCAADGGRRRRYSIVAGN